MCGVVGPDLNANPLNGYAANYIILYYSILTSHGGNKVLIIV